MVYGNDLRSKIESIAIALMWLILGYRVGGIWMAAATETVWLSYVCQLAQNVLDRREAKALEMSWLSALVNRKIEALSTEASTCSQLDPGS